MTIHYCAIVVTTAPRVRGSRSGNSYRLIWTMSNSEVKPFPILKSPLTYEGVA